MAALGKTGSREICRILNKPTQYLPEADINKKEREMKKILIGMVLLAATSGYASESLNCGSFAPRIPGSTTYQVEFNGSSSVKLTAQTYEGALHKMSTGLTKSYQNMDGATYENDQFEVFSSNARVYLQDKRSGISIQCK